MEFINEGVLGEILSSLEYEKIARDLRIDYCKFETNVVRRIA